MPSSPLSETELEAMANEALLIWQLMLLLRATMLLGKKSRSSTHRPPFNFCFCFVYLLLCIVELVTENIIESNFVVLIMCLFSFRYRYAFIFFCRCLCGVSLSLPMLIIVSCLSLICSNSISIRSPCMLGAIGFSLLFLLGRNPT